MNSFTHCHSFFVQQLWLISVFWFFFSTSLILRGKFRSPYLDTATSAATAALPISKVYVVLLCVQTKVWLPALGIFDKHTDVNACDCIWRLCRHPRRVCIESWLCGENPLPHWGIEPASVVCWSDAVPTELQSLPPELFVCNERYTNSALTPLLFLCNVLDWLFIFMQWTGLMTNLYLMGGTFQADFRIQISFRKQ